MGGEYYRDEEFFVGVEGAINQIHQNGLGAVLSNNGIEGLVYQMIDSFLKFNEAALENNNFYCEVALPIILDYEAKIENSTIYSEIEKQAFYTSSSTLRFSLYYWVDYYSQSVGHKNEFVTLDDDKTAKAIFVSCMDAVGATVGAMEALSSGKFWTIAKSAAVTASSFSAGARLLWEIWDF